MYSYVLLIVHSQVSSPPKPLKVFKLKPVSQFWRLENTDFLYNITNSFHGVTASSSYLWQSNRVSWPVQITDECPCEWLWTRKTDVIIEILKFDYDLTSLSKFWTLIIIKVQNLDDDN
jgi:hypothetical protein